jgi:hypothetical protein
MKISSHFSYKWSTSPMMKKIQANKCLAKIMKDIVDAMHTSENYDAKIYKQKKNLQNK